ncbi:MULTISPECIES: hypothetical protein [unclassified Arcicella]|uniref:hypothetical protein n=1 Tax=unclassified Arcicella TaxID=2644986 RepID=UPI00285994A2|nr:MULTISPECIES: hypothetical protein [unclassified Arcicella]MDR6562606.1 hypothetical protein [Arcicella sp. BE51]MDR6812693.1 hypothetical protein [Arcicella sp. BE140]MDR6824005.1 hypothetical protein [Arcicella sp. BE139]
MILYKNLLIVATVILLLFSILSIYYGIISPPPLVTYTTDENFISESGVFLWYGCTPRTLEWAGIPSIFIAYFLFIFQCIIHIITHFSEIHQLTDILKVFDDNAYYYLNHREEFILWERAAQIVIVGIIFFMTIRFIIKSSHFLLTKETKIILVFLCICIETIWVSMAVIRPEAISGSLFIYLVLRILFTEKITPQIATTIFILFIATVAQRLIFLFMTPFIIGSLIVHLRAQKISFRTYRNYFLVILFALFTLIPFIITDTFVILKSFFGVIFIKMHQSPMQTYFNYSFIMDFLSSPVNVFFTICTIIGTWFLLKVYPSKIIILLYVGNLLLFLFTSLKSAQLYYSHLFPATMMSVILIGFGFIGIIHKQKEGIKNKLVLIFCMLLVINSSYGVYYNNKKMNAEEKNLADAISWVKSLDNNETIALELDFDGFIPKNLACLEREKKANISEAYKIDKLSKLLKVSITDSLQRVQAMPVIAQAFASEDEKLMDVEYQVLLKNIQSDTSKRFNTYYFFDTSSMMSHCMLREKAYQQFEQNQYHYIITTKKLNQYQPIKAFEKDGGTKYWVYENKGFKKVLAE